LMPPLLCHRVQRRTISVACGVSSVLVLGLFVTESVQRWARHGGSVDSLAFFAGSTAPVPLQRQLWGRLRQQRQQQQQLGRQQWPGALSVSGDTLPADLVDWEAATTAQDDMSQTIDVSLKEEEDASQSIDATPEEDDTSQTIDAIPDEAGILLPLGSVCPFRSPGMEQIRVDEELKHIVTKTARLVDSNLPIMKRFMQQTIMPDAGDCPDKESVLEGARETGLQMQQVKEFLNKMEASKDFQVLETYWEQELLARSRQTLSYRNWERGVLWQVAVVEAAIAGKPLPAQPDDLELPGLSLRDRPKPTTDDSASGPKPSEGSALPFTEADFDAVPGEEAKASKSDFLKLVQDHKQMLQLGCSFGDFDPSGKKTFFVANDADSVALGGPR